MHANVDLILDDANYNPQQPVLGRNASSVRYRDQARQNASQERKTARLTNAFTAVVMLITIGIIGACLYFSKEESCKFNIKGLLHLAIGLKVGILTFSVIAFCILKNTQSDIGWIFGINFITFLVMLVFNFQVLRLFFSNGVNCDKSFDWLNFAHCMLAVEALISFLFLLLICIAIITGAYQEYSQKDRIRNQLVAQNNGRRPQAPVIRPEDRREENQNQNVEERPRERSNHISISNLLLNVATFKLKPEDYRNMDECSICLEKFNENDQLISLPCHDAHMFHPHCISDWSKVSEACPICRVRIDRNEIKALQRENQALLN
ncbi:unnamed protein product [Moneuplotes crassus]|uniref:RING-type domain-containing protein n=1 Tax=Euplotes crassus TaxID=5936 RepID=A0AAD2D159_EUPCR|nr:unnamed protein product [Moneuplotes crassus]